MVTRKHGSVGSTNCKGITFSENLKWINGLCYSENFHRLPQLSLKPFRKLSEGLVRLVFKLVTPSITLNNYPSTKRSGGEAL